jgi:hypothetical protein
MKFFTRKASRALRTKRGELAWDRLWERYKQHLRNIRPRLAAGWRKIAVTNFHDTEVFSFGQLDDREFIINIDMNPLWKQPPFFICSLHFRGVRRLDVPAKVLGDVLIYDEVHLTSKSVSEWRALLAHSELRIEAEDVEYFINHEPLA